MTDLSAIPGGPVDEICASHILGHLPWPMSFKALGEWARVLRQTLARVAAGAANRLPSAAENDSLLVQRLHMSLIEARTRIIHLDNELRASRL